MVLVERGASSHRCFFESGAITRFCDCRAGGDDLLVRGSFVSVIRFPPGARPCCFSAIIWSCCCCCCGHCGLKMFDGAKRGLRRSGTEGAIKGVPGQCRIIHQQQSIVQGWFL